MSLSLSSILKVWVSTYENPSMDTVYDQMGYDLDELKDDQGMIMVQWLWKVKVDDVDCDDWLDFDGFKKDVAEYFETELKQVDLKSIFARYGLDYTGISFYTPKYYNYEGDSLDIHLKTLQEEYDLEKMGLIPFIEEYIENIRQESYDWYCSFEPTTIDKVDVDDYCTLWAILKKEWVYDELKEIMQWCVEEWYSELVWANANPVYEVKVPNEDAKWWYDRKKFKLEYDEKLLVPIE